MTTQPTIPEGLGADSPDFRRLNPEFFKGPLAEPYREPIAPMPQPKSKRRAMNKTEARYLERLKAQGWDYIRFEAVSFRIGEQRCSYTPDFMTIRGNSIAFHEVKGKRVWDDARVKFQAAVREHGWAVWFWAQWDGKEWREERY